MNKKPFSDTISLKYGTWYPSGATGDTGSNPQGSYPVPQMETIRSGDELSYKALCETAGLVSGTTTKKRKSETNPEGRVQIGKKWFG